uniref:Hexosyltransferase n=1 Tax=Globodera pallida TaxID=36090 RepID=A0A183BLE9_GLOPA
MKADGSIKGGDGKNDTKLLVTKKRFEIRFKNIFKKCWMEFANPCPNQTELLMLTLSRRNGFENRGIRQTWMNDSVPGEVIRFLIADAGEGEAIDVQQKLEEEQAKHGDLLFLHGFDDIYINLYFKVYGGFEWQQSFCANAEWVLKVDDDALTCPKSRCTCVCLLMPDECFAFRGENGQETADWYSSLLFAVISARALRLGRPVFPNEFFECVWDVTVWPSQPKLKMPPQNPDNSPNICAKLPHLHLAGKKRLCFYPHTIIICSVGIEPANNGLPKSGIRTEFRPYNPGPSFSQKSRVN